MAIRRYPPAPAPRDPGPHGARLRAVGKLTDKDMKRLVNQTRSSNIGPTALYYAGVTAPVISAAMALMTRNALSTTPVSSYWTWFLSSLCAAMAGIVWYLIFVRWSYRHHAGRASETGAETVIDLTQQGLQIRRGAVETRIAWAAVQTVRSRRSYTLITFDGADPLIVPDKWFAGDKAAALAFKTRLNEGAPHGAQQKKARRKRA
ncbi:YcxB family protein [Henriciella aquimarina]|uniref:YcxB family protein n=1 Tax=Henriciella aquimarina TaxID=545261 RepID=UPI0009FFA8AD|nr:YcxB family protein [Henriciella aquimarina]